MLALHSPALHDGILKTGQQVARVTSPCEKEAKREMPSTSNHLDQTCPLSFHFSRSALGRVEGRVLLTQRFLVLYAFHLAELLVGFLLHPDGF